MQINDTSKEYGGLNCRVIDALAEGEEPSLLIVVCHGYGAPGTDLVPISYEVLHQFPHLSRHVQFICPAAPISLGGFGPYESRAWWELDIQAVEEAISKGAFVDRSNILPEGLVKAREVVSSLLKDIAADTSIPMSRTVLSGFSQGSMVMTDAAFHAEVNPAALCIFSGTLLCQQEWSKEAANRNGLKVLQSHGKQDPLLSFDTAISLRELMENAGLDVNFIPFDGPHTIPEEAMSAFGELIDQVSS